MTIRARKPIEIKERISTIVSLGAEDIDNALGRIWAMQTTRMQSLPRNLALQSSRLDSWIRLFEVERRSIEIFGREERAFEKGNFN